MRQFGLRQHFPLHLEPSVPCHDHCFTCKGQTTGTEWLPRVQKYVDDWLLATEMIVEEISPHTQRMRTSRTSGGSFLAPARASLSPQRGRCHTSCRPETRTPPTVTRSTFLRPTPRTSLPLI